MDEFVKILKALSDKTRTRIIKVLLNRKTLCVCEIMQALNISQTRASKHLKILKDAGLVTDKKKGLWTDYSIKKTGIKPYARALLKIMDQSVNNDSIVIGDKKRLSKAVKLSNLNRCNSK